MAWKRGTQNNTAGEIRKGHIREFLLPSSKSIGIVGKLKILSLEETEFYNNNNNNNNNENYYAFICSPNNNLPEQFHSYIENNYLYIHSHEHPRCILTAIINENVPKGCIILNEIQRVNSKVCAGEIEDWTIYQGDSFVYDGREGVIGNTEIRHVNKPISILKNISVSIRPRFLESIKNSSELTINGRLFAQHLQKLLFGAILSTDELYLCTPPQSCLDQSTNTHESIPIVCRVGELEALDDDKDIDEEEDFSFPDCYRGIVDVDTIIYLSIEGSELSPIHLIDNPTLSQSSIYNLPNVVQVITSDEEVFPVKRRLLRPCIALTSIVQAGKGKYKTDETFINENSNPNTVHINVDACTFDRVLLYLEHEIRNEEFKFDPLIVNDLLLASQVLQISGLQQLCEKIAGNFNERVRKIPIRFQEVLDRNEQGRLAAIDPNGTGKRGETLLILNGMVLDITRWLQEHPGGSTIIPEQALNIDCVVFFEIYHASRQSFLYLKEFYIGEIAEEDLPFITKGSTNIEPSAAFLEQLNKITSWRLKLNELVNYQTYKSF